MRKFKAFKTKLCDVFKNVSFGEEIERYIDYIKNLKKNAEKEYVIDIDTIPFPYRHICVLSGIEIMKKEIEGLFKIRLRLDPTQAVSNIKTLQ